MGPLVNRGTRIVERSTFDVDVRRYGFSPQSLSPSVPQSLSPIALVNNDKASPVAATPIMTLCHRCRFPPSPTMDQKPKQHRTTLSVVFLVLFVDLIGFSIVFPLFPALLDFYAATGWLHEVMHWLESTWPAMDHGQRAALFGGLLSAVYAGLQFLISPWWGRLSDRIGRRPVLLASIAGNAFAYALWFFAGDFTTFLIARIIAGTMTGNVSTANAVVADITTPENRSKGMAVIGMSFGFGFILGPALGGLSYEYLPRLDHIAWLKDLGVNPFSMPALIALILGLWNLLWTWMRLDETRDPVHASAHSTGRTVNPLKLFSASRGEIPATVNRSTFLHALLFAGLETTMVFLAAQVLGFLPHHNGILFAWMGFEAAMVQGLIFRRLAPRLGQRRLAVAGMSFLMPGFLLVGLVPLFPHAWLLVLGVSVLTLGTGLVFPALNTLASLAAKAGEQGWALGGFRSANALGRALGPLLAAFAYFWIAPSAPFLIGAVGFVIPLILIARLKVG